MDQVHGLIDYTGGDGLLDAVDRRPWEGGTLAEEARAGGSGDGFLLRGILEEEGSKGGVLTTVMRGGEVTWFSRAASLKGGGRWSSMM
jgi:hypothetical protein